MKQNYDALKMFFALALIVGAGYFVVTQSGNRGVGEEGKVIVPSQNTQNPPSAPVCTDTSYHYIGEHCYRITSSCAKLWGNTSTGGNGEQTCTFGGGVSNQGSGGTTGTH